MKPFIVMAAISLYGVFMLWLGIKWQKTEALTCVDCGDLVENDGLCHDCRGKLFSEARP